MQPERESAGYLLAETAHLLRVNAGIALAGLGAMTFLGVVADLYPDFTSLASLASILLNLALQYEISLALLVHYDLVGDRARRRRLWALLGLNLLSGIAILFGLLLLIVPGAYLLVRWWAAAPALIAEDADITEALSLSADAIKGRFWHVFAALLVIWTIGVAGMLTIALVPKGEILIGSLIMNLSLNFCLVAGWHLAVAIYAGRKNQLNLAEVFA